MPNKIDLSGKRFGRVLILNRNYSKILRQFYDGICDCGNHFSFDAASLKRGEKFECKKCLIERRRGVDLTGRKYGRWTVIGMGVDSRNKTVCHCVCDCGMQGKVAPSAIGERRKSMSCGCLGRKMKSKYANTTLYPLAHGLSHSAFYKIRTALIHKCYKENNQSYKLFGAKGITICELWRNSARDMHEWAISKGWEQGDVICLKENEKEFNPQTVLLVKYNEFRSQIGLNAGIHITYKNETHSVQKWAEILGVNPQQLRGKILKNPSVEEVFGSDFRKMIFFNNTVLTNKLITLYNEGKNLKEVSKLIDVCEGTCRYNLIKNGIKIRKEISLKKPQIEDEKILELLKEGNSFKKISRIIGMSSTNIKHRVNKINGIKRDRTKG